MTDADLRSLLATDHVTHVPGIHDPASAALAVRAGHKAAYLSRAAIAATMLGRPDLGFAPATQIADRAAVLAGSLGGIPLLADGDVGFDSPEDTVWTALAYQRAGIGGLVLADGPDVRPSAARITALAEQAPGIAVIAQAGGPAPSGGRRPTGAGNSGSDAAGSGLADVIERARAYAAAGADAILAPEGLGAADLDRLRLAIPGVPLVLSRSEGPAGGPRLTDAELAGLGVRLVLHPLAAVLAALRAESLAYRAIADEGTAERIDRLPSAVLATMTSPPSPPARRPASATLAAPTSAPADLEGEIARIDT